MSTSLVRPFQLLPALLCLLIVGCADNGGGTAGGGAGNGGETSTAEDAASVGYVTNGIASFWVIAEKGAVDAGKEYNAKVTVQMPANGVEDQKRMCQDMLAQGIEGIAISPIDPDNQGDLLAEIAQHTKLITQDSDAPDSDRLCYIGMDNYTAGRMCGELVKEAMPDGGSVMIFVGRLGQANARQRRQGVIDELMDRDHDATRYDEPGDGEIKGESTQSWIHAQTASISAKRKLRLRTPSPNTTTSAAWSDCSLTIRRLCWMRFVKLESLAKSRSCRSTKMKLR